MYELVFDLVGSTVTNVTLEGTDKCISFLISLADDNNFNISHIEDKVTLRMCDVRLYNNIYCKIRI